MNFEIEPSYGIGVNVTASPALGGLTPIQAFDWTSA